MGIYVSHNSDITVPKDKVAAVAAAVASRDKGAWGLPAYSADAAPAEQARYIVALLTAACGAEEELDDNAIIDHDDRFLLLGSGYGKISYDAEELLKAAAWAGAEGSVDLADENGEHWRWRLLAGSVGSYNGVVHYPADPVCTD
jgi:hypothetical protein